MSKYFEGWQPFSPEGATVSFYKKSDAGADIIGFDSSLLEPPGPMVNGMIGLKMLKKGDKLVMINHRFPAGLIPKIENDFHYTRTDLEDQKVKVEFWLKDGGALNNADCGCNG